MDDCVPVCHEIIKSAVLRRESAPSEVEMLFVEAGNLVPNDFTFVKKILSIIEGEAE
jgi:hypothetical protein